MEIRTDLALERRELIKGELPSGVTERQRTTEKTKVTVIEITDENGEKAIGKPKGKYVTVELSEFSHETELTDDRLQSLTEELKALLPKEGLVLVAGLGNESITPDALGPKTVQRIFATRHIGEKTAEEIGLPRLRAVAGIATGVLGQTGMETGEIIKGIVDKIKPAAVITIDALAARNLSRLGKTVQMSDTGIAPGSGVGNARAKINEETLGVPVIAVGIPTVVDAQTLAADLGADENKISEEAKYMTVTSREIDVLIERASKLTALAVNLALQPLLSADDLLAIV